MELERYLKDLSIFYNDQELLQATFKQLCKDLGPLLPEDFTHTQSFESIEDLNAIFKPYMDHYLVNMKSELVQFFYRVDLGEHIVGQALESGDLSLGSQLLAEAVIQRELVKAITRKYYSDPHCLK